MFLLALALPAHAADISIDGNSSGGPSNCIPFGGWSGLSDSSSYVYTGFIYQNVPAFDLYPGDTIAFDLSRANDVDITMDIALAATTSNGGDQEDSNGFTTIVNTGTASSRGNTTMNDFEVEFTVDTAFSFSGGGLIIRFDSKGSFGSDTNCTQVLTTHTSSDSSGYFVKRFYYETDGGYAWGGTGTTSIGGFEITYGYWYDDADGDGYGDSSTGVQGTQPSGYVRDDTDCDDTDADTFPGAAANDSTTDCMTDVDGDDWGEESPASGVTAGTDCDDSSSSVYPGATETVADGIDQDCDDVDTCYLDSDGDGYGTDAGTTTDDDDLDCTNSCNSESDNTDDCDDTDSGTYLGADEYCDSVDNDCDSTVDEDSAVDATTWYADSDTDGYGDPATTDVECSQPSGYVADNTDCDDTDSSEYPGADEYCDGDDDDCDGTTDEDSAVDASTWYADSDSDGYGNASSTDVACDQPSGYVADATDCDDTDGSEYPGADEYCDGDDDDCDGDIDEDSAVDVATWYRDSDSDGYGDAATTDIDCDQPSGYVADASDCDDTDGSEYPGADEYCDGDDDDCDNAIDEDGAVDAETWYADTDGDSYGDPDSTDEACEEPSGYVADDTDCDDTDGSEYPGADEYCDGDDDDCDGEIDEDEALDVLTWYADSDSDGYGDPAVTDIDCEEPSGFVDDDTDCDDTDGASYPGAEEIAYDGIDQDCDGSDLCDADGDGFEAFECEGDDCDDADETIYPGAEERWYDGIDQDCSTGSDYDQDGDGFDSASYGGDDCDDANAETYPGAPDEPGDGVINDCDAADEYDADGDGYDGEAYGGDDCDDANSALNPGATEIWYDGVDQDCDGNDDDQDGDGYGVDEDCDDEDASLYPNAPGLGESCLPLDSGLLDSGLTGGGGGCKGCSTGSSTGFGWLGLLATMLFFRRR